MFENEKGVEVEIYDYRFLVQEEKGNNIVCEKTKDKYKKSFIETSIEFFKWLKAHQFQYVTIEDIKKKDRYTPFLKMMYRYAEDKDKKDIGKIFVLPDNEVLRLKIY